MSSSTSSTKKSSSAPVYLGKKNSGGLIGLIVLIILIGLGVKSCKKMIVEKKQEAVERAQLKAQQDAAIALQKTKADSSHKANLLVMKKKGLFGRAVATETEPVLVYIDWTSDPASTEIYERKGGCKYVSDKTKEVVLYDTSKELRTTREQLKDLVAGYYWMYATTNRGALIAWSWKGIKVKDLIKLNKQEVVVE